MVYTIYPSLAVYANFKGGFYTHTHTHTSSMNYVSAMHMLRPRRRNKAIFKEHAVNLSARHQKCISTVVDAR